VNPSWLLSLFRSRKSVETTGATSPDLSTDESDGTASELDTLKSDIESSINRIPNQAAIKVGLFAHFNRDGTRLPLFWCFNNWVEPIFLANRLGPDQPLYAMTSFHRVVTGKSVKRLHTLSLAQAYVDCMLNVRKDGPFVIGGNCQAAPIAESMAHNVIARTGKVPLLINLEHMPFYCYPGHVLMLFGNRSEKYNPFLREANPIPRWEAQHGAAAWGIVNGGHGQYFVPPAVHDLVSYIQQSMFAFCETGRAPVGQMKVTDVETPRAS
jgi:hypothetical protein